MVRKTATVYHRKFSTEDGDRHEVGADLGMGYEFACDHDADPVDVFPDAYDHAGDVTVDVTEGVDAPHAAAYSAWEDGEGHDVTSTRSMAVGDIIVVDGDAFFVDTIGFEAIDLPIDDDEDDDRDPWDMTPTDAEIAEAFGVDDVDDITDEMLEDVDTPEPPERVDVSGYKTAAGAAKATAKCLREWASFMGYNPDDVVVYDPEDTKAKRDVRSDGVWCVAWEGGPYEWASALTGGTTLTGFAGPKPVYDGEPEVAGLTDGAGFDVECYYSFDILFFNR